MFYTAGLPVQEAVKIDFTQPLLLNSEAKLQDNNVDQEFDDGEEDSDENHKPVTSIVSAYRLLTPSVKVLFLCLFLLLT